MFGVCSILREIKLFELKMNRLAAQTLKDAVGVNDPTRREKNIMSVYTKHAFYVDET